MKTRRAVKSAARAHPSGRMPRSSYLSDCGRLVAASRKSLPLHPPPSRSRQEAAAGNAVPACPGSPRAPSGRTSGTSSHSLPLAAHLSSGRLPRTLGAGAAFWSPCSSSSLSAIPSESPPLSLPPSAAPAPSSPSMLIPPRSLYSSSGSESLSGMKSSSSSSSESSSSSSDPVSSSSSLPSPPGLPSAASALSRQPLTLQPSCLRRAATPANSSAGNICSSILCTGAPHAPAASRLSNWMSKVRRPDGGSSSARVVACGIS
eukprot:scaffold9394_cov124-Isochrysis_galbana.AAC.7